MILNKAESEAIYSAMCLLNNVGTLLHTSRKFLDGSGHDVHNESDGTVRVRTFDVNGQTKTGEVYQNQSEFAKAYGLS